MRICYLCLLALTAVQTNPYRKALAQSTATASLPISPRASTCPDLCIWHNISSRIQRLKVTPGNSKERGPGPPSSAYSKSRDMGIAVWRSRPGTVPVACLFRSLSKLM
ncbi:hypothetical protein V8C37DRAFT_370850 [Trichoderma ceciliae]